MHLQTYADTHTHTECNHSGAGFLTTVPPPPHPLLYSIIPVDGKPIIIPGVSRKLQTERVREGRGGKKRVGSGDCSFPPRSN